MSTSISWRANASKIRARNPGPEVMRGLDASDGDPDGNEAIDFRIGAPPHALASIVRATGYPPTCAIFSAPPATLEPPDMTIIGSVSR